MREFIQEKLRGWAYRVSIGTLLAAFLAGGVIGYWRLINYDVLQIDGKIPVKPLNISAGGVVIETIKYCKSSDVPGDVELELIGKDRIVAMPGYVDHTPKGCGTVNAPIVVPNPVASGIYRVHYTITYHVNPIRTTTEEFTTEAFTVKGIDPLPQQIQGSDQTNQKAQPSPGMIEN